MKRRLSPTQLSVLRYMLQGWVLTKVGRAHFLAAPTRPAPEDTPYPITIRSSTFESLRSHKAIALGHRRVLFPRDTVMETYIITPTGRALVEQRDEIQT